MGQRVSTAGPQESCFRGVCKGIPRGDSVGAADLLEQLRQLPKDELEEVKRQLFFDPKLAGNGSVLVLNQEDNSNDVDSGVAFDMGIEEQPPSGHLPNMRRMSSDPWSGRPSSPKRPCKKVSSDPQVMNRPTGALRRMRSSSPPASPTASPSRKKSTLTEPHDRKAKERDVVVVSSLSLDWEELAKVPGVAMYELRLLWHLYMLKDEDIKMVFCTSSHVPDELVDYYLQYLPNGGAAEAKKRLLMLACNDQRALSVTEKLLSRPRTIDRIKKFIDVGHGYMTCFNSTDSEVLLAQRVGVPIIGNGNDAAFWGTKAGNRQLFREAGVLHPDGSYDTAWTPEELAGEVVALWKRHPNSKKIMVKLNESFSGEGNAILRTSPELRERVLHASSNAQAVRAIMEVFENSLEYVAPCETWLHYSAQIIRLGAICEVFVEGDADKKTSPSCQLFISEKGQVKVFATHEQWLNGQIYLGCHFPADERYAADLVTLTEKIGATLAKHIVGYCAVDFVSVMQDDGSFEHHAIEINVRMGGTTLPIMTLDLLCKQGRFDKATSRYFATDGTARYYTASDNIRKPQYKGLTSRDVMDIVEKHSEKIEWGRRPGAPETGVVFHLVPLLSELGKVGAVCIGRSREEAKELYEKVVEILDEESMVHGNGHTEEFVMLAEGDEADRLN